MKQHETGRFRSGQLAILVLLIVGLVGAFPVYSEECFNSDQCDDGIACNGLEECYDGECLDDPRGDLCPDGQVCSETYNQCIPACVDDTDCDDGLFCNGAEQCINTACVAGSDPCIGLYCDETLNACMAEACFVPAWEHVSHFTGLNCTGIEKFYTLYYGGAFKCLADNYDGAICGEEKKTESIKSYSQEGVCYKDYWPSGNTFYELVSVYREGIPPDGDTVSHFTDPGCNGTELYRIDPRWGNLCSPDGSSDAVCGKELYRETVKSRVVDGVCEDAWPAGIELDGFVKVYRGCGVEGTAECGNGICDGNETCLSCPEDCPSCCEDPDGEQISFFTEYSCEGTEYYEVPADDFEYECAPANPTGAVCGTVLRTEVVRSYGTPDWCVPSLPFNTQLSGLVRVYRDGCVDEEAPECGDGVCNGIETCAWCPGDCGGPCSGNGFCDIGECSAYPDDCSVDNCCGNGTCDDMGDNPPENCLNCEEDCGECPPPDDPYCGDGVCNGKETVRTCPKDCKRPSNKPDR